MAYQDLKLVTKLAQKQVLTLGLVQMVSLLTLNKLELTEMIQQELVQNPVLEEGTEILETLPLSRKERRDRLEGLIEEFGISHVRRSLADTLSGGERRRVEIARSLVISPKFILLDEPFSGIDPITVLEIQKIINHLKSKQIGVLITDHNVRETLQVTDRAYIINNGSIFRSGTPKELGNDTEVKRVYLGEHFSLN